MPSAPPLQRQPAKDVKTEASTYGTLHWFAFAALLVLVAGVGKAAIRRIGEAGPRGDKARGKYAVLETIREEGGGEDDGSVEMGVVNGNA